MCTSVWFLAPTIVWNVILSRLRMIAVLLSPSAIMPGSTLGGTGRGILPRGPRTIPRNLPIVAICGTSDKKKSCFRANFLAFCRSPPKSSILFGSMTMIPAAFALVAISASANIAMLIFLPRPCGRRTFSSILFVGFFKSTSLMVNAISMLSTNFRSGASPSAFFTASVICSSIFYHPCGQRGFPLPQPVVQLNLSS